METKDMLLQLRTQKGWSQDMLAEKVHVTRQAVSRWENGDTVPNTETLKLLSALFDVSINTILGSPRELICQCCGMPLDDSTISREPDGAFNEDYCNGAIRTAHSSIRARNSSLISVWSTCRAKAGPQSRSGRIWKRSCRTSSIGSRFDAFLRVLPGCRHFTACGLLK